MVPGDRDHVHHVHSAWLHSAWRRPDRELTSLARVNKGLFYALYSPVVDRLIRRSQITIAALPDVSDVALGWIAVEGNLLHYVYTKMAWRRLGIGRYLVEQRAPKDVLYTHLPRSSVIPKVPATWKYDPMRRFERMSA